MPYFEVWNKENASQGFAGRGAWHIHSGHEVAEEVA
jgi:hypothetical protein